MATKKRPLTAAEKGVCARLKQLWEKRAEALGLTQESAADALGISQGAVSHYLNGRNAIGFEAMFRWAQMLRVHPYEIDAQFAERLPPDLRLAVDSMLVSASPRVAGAYKQLVTSALQLHESTGSSAVLHVEPDAE